LKEKSGKNKQPSLLKDMENQWRWTKDNVILKQALDAAKKGQKKNERPKYPVGGDSKRKANKKEKNKKPAKEPDRLSKKKKKRSQAAGTKGTRSRKRGNACGVIGRLKAGGKAKSRGGRNGLKGDEGA